MLLTAVPEARGRVCPAVGRACHVRVRAWARQRRRGVGHTAGAHEPRGKARRRGQRERRRARQTLGDRATAGRFLLVPGEGSQETSSQASSTSIRERDAEAACGSRVEISRRRRRCVVGGSCTADGRHGGRARGPASGRRRRRARDCRSANRRPSSTMLEFQLVALHRQCRLEQGRGGARQQARVRPEQVSREQAPAGTRGADRVDSGRKTFLYQWQSL